MVWTWSLCNAFSTRLILHMVFTSEAEKLEVAKMLKAKLGNEVLLWMQKNGKLDCSEHQNQFKSCSFLHCLIFQNGELRERFIFIWFGVQMPEYWLVKSSLLSHYMSYPVKLVTKGIVFRDTVIINKKVKRITCCMLRQRIYPNPILPHSHWW